MLRDSPQLVTVSLQQNSHVALKLKLHALWLHGWFGSCIYACSGIHKYLLMCEDVDILNTLGNILLCLPSSFNQVSTNQLYEFSGMETTAILAMLRTMLMFKPDERATQSW